MGSPTHTYTADPAGGATETIDSALAALGARFTVCDGAPSPGERTWLDTFDWRLYRAGWLLTQTTAADAAELVLTARDGTVIARQVGQLALPAQIDGVPAGAIRDHLAAAVEPRALLPVASSAGRARHVALLDAEQKTLVRLLIEQHDQLEPMRRPLPVRLVIRPLRGYESAGRRVARLLESVPGVEAETRPALDLLLADSGRSPGDYTGRVDVRLTPDLPAPVGVATILAHLLDTFERNLQGTLDDVDTEFLHDLRVAVRRTRSALKLTGDALPGTPVDRYAAEFKWLGDLTTPTRDLDVYLLQLPAMKHALSVASPTDLDPLGAQLARRRAGEFGKLKRGLRTVRLTRLRESWRGELSAVIERADAEPRFGALAADRLAKTYRRLIKLGQRITDHSPAEDLHRVRKRGKELRYLLEFFATLYDPAICGPLVRDLKRLQDCLGEFQDTEVQAIALRGFAEELVSTGKTPAGTLLAMGELTEQLHRRQGAARKEFGDRFERFAGPTNVRRMDELTAGAAR